MNFRAFSHLYDYVYNYNKATIFTNFFFLHLYFIFSFLFIDNIFHPASFDRETEESKQLEEYWQLFALKCKESNIKVGRVFAPQNPG